MSSDDWPDWLPADWTMQIKMIDQRKVKCYVDSQGHKCYSKPQVFNYLKKIGKKQALENTDNANGSALNLSVAPENEVIGLSPGGPPAKLATRSSRKKSLVMQEAEGVSAGDGSSPSGPLSSERSHGDSSWLPDGWTVEVKTRKGGNSTGMKYKCYTDPISGQKFFSKPQVLSHLAKSNRSVGGLEELNTEPIIATPISAWRESASTEPDNSQTYEATEDEKNKSEKKTESGRLYSDRRVVTRTPAEGLPPGWIKELRLRNDGIKRDPFFVDPLSEYVFFSKKDALRYLEAGDVKSCVMKPMRRDMNADVSLNTNLNLSGDEMASPPVPSKGMETSEVLTNGCVTDSKTNGSGTENLVENPVENPKPIRSITGGVFSTPDASQKETRTRFGGSYSSPKEEVSDWLPDGWTVEVHYKSSGMRYKIYKESASGKKFYSKPQVLDYLANGSGSNSRKRKENNSSVVPDSSQNPKRSKNKKENSDFEEVITTTPADGLPPGWIKEIRTKIFATHKRNDPFYIDPVSGYIFRSKLDALRFLETGDVNVCAMRPKMKDKDGNEVFVHTNAVPKPVKTTGEQLVEGGENSVAKQDNDVSSAGNTPARGRVSSRIANRSNSPTSSPAQSSKRQKGVNLETGPSSGGLTENNGAVQEKQGSGVNLEKEPDDGHLSYDIPEDDNWTDQCIDFAVKTLTDEILINGQPASGAFQEENGGVETGVNKIPTKLN